MYKSDGFYLYVQKFEYNNCDANSNDLKADEIIRCKQKYYNLIEKSFSFVATELINLGEIEFVKRFQVSEDEVALNERSTKNQFWEKFKKEILG